MTNTGNRPEITVVFGNFKDFKPHQIASMKVQCRVFLNSYTELCIVKTISKCYLEIPYHTFCIVK